MSIFIMAQGQQTRMRGAISTRKQLLQVNDEPILCRTLRQLREQQTVLPFVVGWHDLLGHLLPDILGLLTLDIPGDCILDGIAATEPWWSGPLLFLLGDVVFSDAALNTIVERSSAGGDMFFAATSDLGRGSGEAFALFAPDHDELRSALSTVPCRWAATGGTYQGGHLRNLLWEIMRMRCLRPDYQFSAQAEYHTSLVEVISDWTTDIDTPDDLGQLPYLSECARKEMS